MASRSTAGVTGFPTPSRKLEFFSQTLKDWKWPEHALPGYIRSHVHCDHIDRSKGEYVLLPTFRLPTLIHTRSGNAKWLYEISHTNPLWLHPHDAERLGADLGSLLKVETEIGYFVIRVWVTEAIAPASSPAPIISAAGVLTKTIGGDRWSTALVDLQEVARGSGGCGRSTALSPSRATTPIRTRLVERCRRAPEPDLPGPSRPGERQHCWHQKVPC